MEYSRSATNLTAQLLGVARGGKYEAKPISINDLVMASSTMFNRTKKEIRIHRKFQDPPPVVVADRRQIEQVLLNIYINAWQAMEGGGEIYLETSVLNLNAADCRPYSLDPGQYVRISITDTGVGMDEKTQARIFDPFFTTKKMGRGTGLGLASAYGIIKNHAGVIQVDSELGEGASFDIYLPLSDQREISAAPFNQDLSEGSETILLVDDEKMIIDVGKALLEKLGYKVLTANSGMEAIEIVQKKGSGIDLVILDMIMPGMDGSKTFDRIRELGSTLPVILSSGYSLSGQANDIIQRGCNGFLQKPFSIKQLSEKVRTILDEGS
jgi:CheY-like chemotaxis protein